MNKRQRFATTFFAIFCGLCLASPARAESKAELLGVIDFPTSGAREAQPHFIEGVLYLHNFEYREAQEAFVRAQEIDPDFAMAFWGEAMTYNHSLWQRQSRKPARDALNRLGKTPEERRAKAPTEREKDYLHAVEILFGAVDESRRLPKDPRDDLYRDAMRRLHEKYPDDLEAAAFYGLSILATSHEGRDFAIYMQAAAVLTGVWDANRLHPGGAHYLIHSYDDPVHAPLGLPMARAYSKIAPAAAHAQHMVSHIFVALGMWDDLVTSNEIAIKVEDDSGEKARPMVLGHYPQWLEYGLLEQGRFGAARKMMSAGHARFLDRPTLQEPMYYGLMLARYVVDTEDWEAADRWAAEVSTATRGARDYYFVQAYAAVQRGDLAKAREHLATLRTCAAEDERAAQTGVRETLEKEIMGLIALKEGKKNEAIALLSEAAEKESSLPLSFGPPTVSKPSYELLGEAQLELGRHEDAAESFRKQLARTPRRTASLMGLARAAKALGDEATSEENYTKLAAIWHSADLDLPAYAEATRAAAGGE